MSEYRARKALLQKKIADEDFAKKMKALQAASDNVNLYNDSESIEERLNAMAATNRKNV